MVRKREQLLDRLQSLSEDGGITKGDRDRRHERRALRADRPPEDSFASKASAVAMANPRDICFVLELSGSMNDDTEPCWATNEITNTFAPRSNG